MNRNPDNKPSDTATPRGPSPRQGDANEQSQRQGEAVNEQSQRQGGAANERSQRQDNAAKEPPGSSSDEGHDADRGIEGNKTRRNQKDKPGTDNDQPPPLQSPQDDLA